MPYLLSLLMLLCCSCSALNQKPKLLIACAANMQFAMEELSARFSQLSGIDCEIILASSGKLCAQIQEGAPYDLFISANQKYPEYLKKEQRTIGEIGVFAKGSLVLWTAQKLPHISWSSLLEQSIDHIAIANPKTAPYGLASKEALKKAGLWAELEHKLVYGESIAQTNQFILSGSADIGLTANAVVLAPALKAKGSWTAVPEQLYQPINQTLVKLKNGQANLESKEAFYQFLFSKEAKEILDTFGYETSLQKAADAVR